MRENFLPLLELAGVDLVLSGHSHSYERSFLLDGHYGLSTTLDASMIIDGGSGDPSIEGAYNKVSGSHAGAVYCVTGSAGKVTAADLDHPAMYHSVAVMGSVVLDVDGGSLSLTFLDESGTVDDTFTILNESFEGTYCVAGTHSDGCMAQISSTGMPSATDPAPFDVAAVDVKANQFGVLLYGYGPANQSLGGGRLCVASPFVRGAALASGGSSPCSGEFHVDVNALIQSGGDPGLSVGTTVYAQYWFRDPMGAGTQLSDALQFIIRP